MVAQACCLAEANRLGHSRRPTVGKRLMKVTHCVFGDIMKVLRYIKLRAGTKIPLERDWPNRVCDPGQAIADGYGIGLVLGMQPDGRYLIALDVDTEGGKEFLMEREIPLCPTIWSKRGPKLLFTSPIQISHAKIHDGIEVLGERHQVCLPSPHSPDGRYWGPGLEVEIPEAPSWLVEMLRNGDGESGSMSGISVSGACTAQDFVSDETPSTDRPPSHARALQAFLDDVAPLAIRSDSNKPLLCGAAIVAHRMDDLRGDDLVKAVQWANGILGNVHRVSRSEAAAVARSVERNRLRFNPRVLHERTGIPLDVCKTMLGFIREWDRGPRSPTHEHLSPQEISTRVLTTVCCVGRRVGWMILWHGTIADLARETGVSCHTLKRYVARRYLGPLILIQDVRRGPGGGMLLASPLRLLINSVFRGLLEKWLKFGKEKIGAFCLSRYRDGRYREYRESTNSSILYAYSRDGP